MIDQSIAQLTGLENDLPQFPSIAGGLNSNDVIGLLSQYGFSIDGGDTSPTGLANMVNNLINGQPANIISWSDSGSVPLVDQHYTIPLFSLGVPDIASAEIDATFGVDATLNYNVGFGVDSHGFYLNTGNLVSLSFGANAGLEGQVEVFGFPLADAGGDIGFSINPYVDLTAHELFGQPKPRVSQRPLGLRLQSDRTISSTLSEQESAAT